MINSRLSIGKINSRHELSTAALASVPFYKTETVKERMLGVYRNALNKSITFSDISGDARINGLIDDQDNGLVRRGELINLHDRDHVERTVKQVQMMCKEVGLNKRVTRLASISALMHDIGNSQGRKSHAEKGAVMAETELLRMVSLKCKMKLGQVKQLYEFYKGQHPRPLIRAFNEVDIICHAINMHSELRRPLNADWMPESIREDAELVAALVIDADKEHIESARTRKVDLFDEHRKVNLCIRKSSTEFTPKEVIHILDLDEDEIAKLYGSREKFIDCLKYTDGSKFYRRQQLHKQYFKRDFKVSIDGEVYSVQDLFEGMKPTTFKGVLKSVRIIN